MLTLGIFGVFGVLCSIVLIKIFHHLRKRETLVDIFKINSIIETSQIDIKRLNIASVEDKLNILNYRQIIRGYDVKLKKNLISILSQNPSKENISLIRDALNDENEMVRILASTSIQKIDDYFISNIVELQKSVETDKNKLDIYKLSDIYFQIGQFYDEYIFSELVSSDIKPLYMDRMEYYYDLSYGLSGFKDEYLEKYIRACIRNKKIDKARRLIDYHLQLYPSSISVIFWKCDFYLQAGRYREIQSLLKNIDIEFIKKVPKLYKAYTFWFNLDGAEK